MTLLSVLIPSRNEMFLARTVEGVLAAMRGDSEVIVVLDGPAADPLLPEDPRLRVIVHPVSTGQRASTNEAARLARGEYFFKLDAHCAVDEGFDVKLTERVEPDWTVIPRMYNLHAFDWVCAGCGERTYQGPMPERCKKCNHTAFNMDMVWQPRWNRKTDFARFDTDLHFQYWSAYSRRPEAQPNFADTLCQVGAGWLMRRERYWELGGLDEDHGSWGQMGVEISCKSFLSGGRQVVNKDTWFAHLFRTQPGFSFPYPMSGTDQEHAREHSRQLWLGNSWSGAKHTLDWLLDKFAPVPGWHDESSAPPHAVPTATPSWGLVYYTDNRCDPALWEAVQLQLLRCCGSHDLVSVSLQPMNFGRNICLPLERGALTMFKQILAGLEASTADVVYLCEHDVMYHPSHFLCQTQPGKFHYNTNNFKVDLQTGKALYYLCHQTLALCARRELLLQHYRARVARVEAEGGYNRAMGFEPGDHRTPRGVDDFPSVEWRSEFPNLDVRHGKNLTPSRWKQEQFRNPKACTGWLEVEEVPGWGRTVGRMQEVLNGVLPLQNVPVV